MLSDTFIALAHHILYNVHTVYTYICKAGNECPHCKAGPHRIGIHHNSKGINRYFFRI
jgi:hypothetical protein